MKEKIFYGNEILTMEDCSKKPLAVKITNGIITKLYYNKSYENEICEKINLKNNCLMPSFIDSHSHIVQFADSLRFINLSTCKDFKDICKKIKDFIKDNNISENQWVVGFAYDNNFLEEKKHPNAKILDEISENHPILITHTSGHMGVLNTSGLKLNNISSSTSNPDGGYIEKDENGNPTGYLEEKAFMNISKNIPQADEATMEKLLLKAQKIYLSYGITTAQEGIMTQREFNILKKASKNNNLICDIVGYADMKKAPMLLEENISYYKKYINHLKIGGYKIFLDGSPQGRTAWMKKSYKDDKNYFGYPIYKDKEVENFVSICYKNNIQLLCHCNGDAAIEQYLSALLKEKNQNDIRPVIIHSQFMEKSQLDKVKEVSAIPSYFIAHTYFWGDIHIKNFGKERADFISPLKSTLNKNILFTLHQDTPVILPDMLFTVWCAASRITKNNVPLRQDEAITPYQALKALTINGAYQYFEENTKGSIKEGKMADFIILSENPLKCSTNKIKNIKILQTIKNGETVYEYKKNQ